MRLAEWRARMGPGHVVLVLMVAVGLLWLGWWGWGKYQEPRQYPYSLATSGGPPGYPVWVEDQIFGRWIRFSGGSVGEVSWEEPPSGGGILSLSGTPVPETWYARWFSFREQTFYELDMELPEDLEERVRRWYRAYSRSEGYRHTLLAGYSGDGRARLWWRVNCVTGIGCRDEDTRLFPIVREAQAEEVDGDPGRYRESTEWLIDKERMPADVEVPE